MIAWSTTTSGVPCWRARRWSSCLVIRGVRSPQHADFVVGEILLGERFHHLAALIVETAQLARLAARKSIAGDERHRDGGVGVADHGVGEPVGIDLAPTHGLARRGAA